eukprot:ANDGO_02195.mRNA.1 Replication factor C subunit 2
MSLPWIEKYRPKTLSEVVHQPEVVSALSRAISSQNLPHLLFYGPPGTGKTSVVHAAARDLFGTSYRERVLELNASDERGIQVVRTKIKTFAQGAVSSGSGSLPPYKLLILDEADNMTTDAQAALRRTMEEYARVTRFCLLCNYVSKIIDPIASRCAKFRFKPLPLDALDDRILLIAERENIRIAPDARAELASMAAGDLRRAITLLQATSQLSLAVATSTSSTQAAAVVSPSAAQVSLDDVRQASGAVPAARVRELAATLGSSRQFAEMEQRVEALSYDGYSGAQVLRQLVAHLVSNSSSSSSSSSSSNSEKSALGDLALARTCIVAAQAEKAMADGADETLQLLHLCAYAQKVCPQQA